MCLLPRIAPLLVLVAAQPSIASAYHVDRILHLGGEGGWDYVTVDPARGLIYLPRVSHTQVVEAASGRVVADIPGQNHNHGVALVPDAGRGFITDGEDASVTVFDLKTSQVLGKIKAADDADGIIYDPASGRLLVSCGDSAELIPIDPKVDPGSGSADPAVPLGGKPEFLVSDGRGRVYVNLADKSLLAVVDTRAMKVIATWPTAPGGDPVGLSMDRTDRLLFIGCRKPQKLVVMNADYGRVVADLPIGAGVDATAYADGRAFASCRDGTLTVASKASGSWAVDQVLATKPGARTMGLDAATGTIYLPTAEFSSGGRRPAPLPGSFMLVVVKP